MSHFDELPNPTAEQRRKIVVALRNLKTALSKAPYLDFNPNSAHAMFEATLYDVVKLADDLGVLDAFIQDLDD